MTDKKPHKQPAVDVEALQQQIVGLTDALQRERADATNIRRRHDEQLANLKTSTKAQVVKDLLPIVDNFERALKHIPKELEANSYIKGVEAIVRQFEKTLADIGVQKIQTVGAVFNPHEHEAVSMEEGESGKEIVSEELQSGYKVGDQVIRHAMVRVRG
ncbi:MAG: nucleotide exchange factor GrpE [Candidatus Saccharimonadales bacterium]